MKSRTKNEVRPLVSILRAVVLSSAAAHATAATGHVEQQSAASTRSQAARRGQSTATQVAADLRNARLLQARGEVTAARNSAIRAWLGANIAHSIPTTSRSLNPVLLFPERDALHFFAWNTATELVYIDLSHGSINLAWRASLDPEAQNFASTKVSAPYAFMREEIVRHEDGVCPVITTPLVYFEVEYDSFGGLLYGRVTPFGNFVALGRDALNWHYYDGTPDGGANGAVSRVGGQWFAWPKVRSISGERDSFAKLNRQPAGPVAVSNASQAFVRLAHQYLAKGDLTGARNAALAAWSMADIPDPRKGKTSDVLMDTYLFPEGQALRFFTWDMEYRINYVEIRENSVALAWAADLDSSERRLNPEDKRMVAWPSNLMPRVPYKFDSGSAMTREYGIRPDIEGALVFFQVQYAVADMGFGRVAVDGSLRPWHGAALKQSDHHYDVVPIPGEHIAAPADRVLQPNGSVKISNSRSPDGNVSRAPLRILKGHTNVIFSVVFSHNGKQLATVSADDSASIWDTTSWTQLPLQGASAFGPLAFSPDDKVLASSNGNLWDTLTGQKLEPPRVSNGIDAVAFSPDGKTLAACSRGKTDGAVILFSTETWKPVRSISLQGFLRFLVYSPDGGRLAVGAMDSVALVEVKTGRTIHTLSGEIDKVSAGAFSPDGKVFATGGCSNFTSQLWDPHTGMLRRSLGKHGNEITGVAFSPDGSMLATCIADGTAKLWNVRSGTLLWTFVDGIERIFSVAFSPDGKLLATGDAYAKTMIWAVPVQDMWRVSSK